LWIILQKGNLESLLELAKELENKYEWLQAAERYKKALELVFSEKDIVTTADLNKKIGFCYYRAAFQAQINVEFKRRLKLAIQAFKKEIKILEEGKKENERVRITHAKAWILYIQSWLESSAPKKKKLLTEWWALENRVLEAYERVKDVHSVGQVCTEMIEFSRYALTSLIDYSEAVKLEKEVMRVIDKAIKSISESDDIYDRAMVYCFASVNLSWNFVSPELIDKRSELVQRCRNYSKKALELSLKTGDAWLIGNSYISFASVYLSYDINMRLAAEYGEKILKYGKIAKDNRLLSQGAALTSSAMSLVEFLEDPDKQRERCEKAIKLAQECIHVSQIIDHMIGVCMGYAQKSNALVWLAIVETDPRNREALLEKVIEMNRESLKLFEEWKRIPNFSITFLGASFFLLAGTRSEVKEKKVLIIESISYQKKYIAHQEEFFPHNLGNLSMAYYWLAFRQNELANIESDKTEKTLILKKALAYLEKSNELLSKSMKTHPKTVFEAQVIGKHNFRLGKILQDIYFLTKEQKTLSSAIEAYKTAAVNFKKTDLPTHAAESYWHMAYLLSQRGEHQEAFGNYELASEAYNIAAKTIPQLKEFYGNYSDYMKAWSQIEQARYSHSIEEYNKAKEHYKKSAELHESTEHWSYLAPNYFAWASMEEAESLSRKEKTQQAKQRFREALQKFSHAKESIKQKLDEITTSEEKEMTKKLFEATELRRKYCRFRILLEEAKLLDREGKYLQSSRSYGKAAQEISAIVDKIDVEAERKELEYIAILCRAWEKMANAEETTSSESYLEAAALFESAKTYCFTRKASLWALGNNNFCRGLAAGLEYKTSLDLADHTKAKGYIKNASTNYLQAGFKNASEYAKATQRLFDAYVFINQAEGEIDQEKRAKQYQMAENLLQIAAGSFMKAKQPEKTTQVKQILENVREEKALALSLSQVLQAPTIASSTLSFTAPTPTSEASVGLESFEHANVQANLVTQVKEVKVGESFCLSVEFVNAGREPALLMHVEDFVPHDFVVVKKPEIYRLEDTTLKMKGKQLAPLKLVEVKLTLQPSKKGDYRLNPKVHYLDELGQNKSLQLKSLEIKVEEVHLEDRVSTGTQELDSLLLGGIPQEYAVILTGPPSDEREYLIKNFLNAGIKEDEVVFYVSTEANGLETLLKNSSFYLFLCNPKPKTRIPDLPNIYKLRSKTDLTNLSISLAKAYRTIDQSKKKRICADIVSDVLVDYETKATRKWISELITDLGSKGFTTLGVLDPSMHPPDQANAVINLFDGEISITKSGDPLECKKSILIKKLRNQDYIKNPICLT
jgi:KaiC/GvpD/RAD55 family RecA-like ATPase